ncbi:hypothetical protein LRR81_01645 [Metabacillus sp. GX 13764]|uniref:hypothetical protein n=1 Tax=Metabacillus kandeliae TaxID=2900151 RepID=UPI001E2CC361|nr:hypothetical protein [Metabacillus kandeliae]MCD7032915.1 hypothetical protein [Metabacillus kandeliae]
MISWTKKHTLILVFSLAVIAGIYYLIYTSQESPLLLQQKNTQKSIETTEQLLADAQKAAPEEKAVTPFSLAELEKEIPTNRFEEEFLMDIEKAEVLSNSTLKDASFTDESFTDQDQQNTSSVDAAQPAASSTQEAAGTTEQAANQAGADKTAAALPLGLQKLTIAVSAQSNGFQEMKKFLQTLESLKRITQIEGLSIKTQPEITSQDQAPEPLEFTATISAFYMPDLPDLKNQLPPFPKTLPADKNNPLQSFEVNGGE